MIPALKNTIKAFEKSNLQLALIVNPTVGDLVGSDCTELLNSQNVIPAVNFDSEADNAVNSLMNINISSADILAILSGQDNIDDYKKIYDNCYPKYILCPDERQMRRTIRKNKVLFEDKFNKQVKNSDYIKCPDEFFSEDHLFYKEEGYIGFGDYSIIGNNYDEGRFSPYAVAIHIVYLSDDNRFRIHHFVSDSNYDIKDVAGKFYEAATKLFVWYNNDNYNQKTEALQTMLDYYAKGYYPGLPTVKKLSIMHHLELVNRFLNAEEVD